MILVTGSKGLIGTAVTNCLEEAGHMVRTFDIRDDPRQDLRDPAALEAALDGVDGVIHLAAVSRVVWAERDPDQCRATNVDALSRLIGAARARRRPPWLIFSSSREVYGEQEVLPVAETAALRPMNAYARSKVAGETLVAEAARQGMTANVARFSNVYGSVHDHHDRVVPAFARAAATGGVVRVEGADHMFDFTHVTDVARGVHRLVALTMAGQCLDPVHFVTGRGTTLRELAGIAAEAGNGGVIPERHPPRSYDVARFRGNPDRAARLLGWKAEIGIAEGFARLAEAYRDMLPSEGEVAACA
jgi:nucleoside-diphosphate-sugar epimerase